MTRTVDPIEFHKSIAAELSALKDRVRSLIGNANWSDEGRYKEGVLRSVIKKFLTDEFIIGTGYVVGYTQGKSIISNQIDILIIDKKTPPLFKDGDLIITTPKNVKAMIEVKTRLSASNADVIQKSINNGQIVRRDIFNGIFAYEVGSTDFDNTRFREVLRSSKGEINHIAFGNEYFIKFWDRSADNAVKDTFSIYKIDNFAFSYFIFNLVESLYPDMYLEREWFLYPIEGTKEAYKIKDVEIDSLD